MAVENEPVRTALGSIMLRMMRKAYGRITTRHLELAISVNQNQNKVPRVTEPSLVCYALRSFDEADCSLRVDLVPVPLRSEPLTTIGRARCGTF